MKKTIILAGGGTGGHVFPLVAVAKAMNALRPDVELLFVGTDRGMESKFVPAQGFPLRLFEVLPMRGGGVAQLARGAGRALKLVPDSIALLRESGAIGVLSIGGYAAGPVSFAAYLAGLPLGLIEPNSVIGLSNQLIAPLVDRAYTAFSVTERYFAPDVVRSFGVPLRPGFFPLQYSKFASEKSLLILGGSQGAKALNELLPQVLAELPFRVRVVHQCGEKHAREVEERYASAGMTSVRVVPFIDDMTRELGAADLVISRSGASAVSEIAAVGRPALFIPYPYASGDHQRVNAEVLAALGGAAVVSGRDTRASDLREALLHLLGPGVDLAKMAESSAQFGRPQAASAIARDFFAVCGIDCKNAPSQAASQEAALS
jgi:UDP-N-acetylglucosamine--N-acetylmuramyl-(pentapeptide) pyrophosphoryl-undecaprenol N-acetylglucosamine transferase